MDLLPGKRYRFWVNGEPLNYSVVFEKVILVEHRPPLPRLDPHPPLPIENVYFQFRFDSGNEMTVSASELIGARVELVQQTTHPAEEG